MPDPIDDETKAKILEVAREGTHSRAEIARTFSVSTTTVSRFCFAAGISFDRSATDAATKAKLKDLAAARVVLAGSLLDDVAEARQRLHAAETARDFGLLARAVHDLADAHVKVAAVDQDASNLDESREQLSLFGNMIRWAVEREPEFEAERQRAELEAIES
jgi:DNA invertase Pin-like site-specific DNA recombinase